MPPDTQKHPDPLDHLAAIAESSAPPSMDSAPGSEGTDPAPPSITNAQALAGALGAGREAFCFFTKLSAPRSVLTDSRISELAALAEPVLAKHGIDLGQYLGDYAPELALAVATFGIVVELRAAVAAEVASKAKTEPSAGPVTVDAEPNGHAD